MMPRVVWVDGQPVLLDAFGLPHTAADLATTIAHLQAQQTAALDALAAAALRGAITTRQAWLTRMTTLQEDAVHAA